MAEDLERLVVQLSADLTRYQRDMAKFNGVTDKVARQAERRFATMNKRLDSATAGIGRGLTQSFGAIGSALAVKEVAAYADAWTSAKNSLAIAGVVGEKQAAVLEKLFESAQHNAQPVEALTDLYGKAAQAQKELGASSSDLAKFADGVAVSLKVAGKSSTQASGALTQLGQLLGSSRVMAEEFNSVNEGARPILMAVAAGLDEAGGSVSKLKTLVNDGAVSNRQFFDAFLRGMPVVEAMAKNAVPTLSQNLTKVENALTKYIGTQDQALGASVVLSTALNALVDNFDETADVVLKVAGVIAAVLVGRAIGGMIASLGLAGGAVLRFVAQLKAAQSVAAAGVAVKGLTAAAGPLGAAFTVAAVAGTYLYLETQKAAEAATRAAEAIEQVGDKAKGSAKDVSDLVDEMAKLSKAKLLGDIGDTSALITQKAQALPSMNPFMGARFSTPSSGLNDALNDYFRGAAEGAFKEFDNATDKFLKGGSLPDYKRALDDLAKRFPAQAAKLAEAQKAADLYTAAIDRRALQDRALAQQDAPETAITGPKRIQGEAYKGEAERAADRTATTDSFISQRQRDEARSDRDKEIEKKVEELVKASGKAADALNMVAIRAQAAREVDAEIVEKASKEFSGDAIKDYVDRVIKAESSGNRFAKNPNSTATGLGQFIDSTWIDQFKKAYSAEYAKILAENGGSRAAADKVVLSYRTNADISKNLIENYARENAAALQRAGLAVTEANLHLAHFLGAGGAVKALKADPSASASQVLGADVVNANKSVFKTNTVGDAIAYADRRANATRIAAGDLTPAEKSAKEEIDILKDSDRRTEALKRETEAINQNTYAKAYNEEKSRLLKEYEDQQIALTPEVVKGIEEKAAAFAKQSAAQDEVKISADAVRDAQDFFASGATSAFTDIIMGASTAKEAVRKLASQIAEAGIQALLLGKGPLAGLFGTANASGGTGGLFGGLFGLFGGGGAVKAATGGRVVGPGSSTSDSIPAYLSDGEHVINAAQARKHRKLLETINTGKVKAFAKGGAVGVPGGAMIDASRLVPTKVGKAPIGRAGGDLRITTSINLEGANGDETIARIAREEAEKGTAKGLQAYDRNFRNRVRYMDNHEV